LIGGGGQLEMKKELCRREVELRPERDIPPGVTEGETL